MRVFPCEVCSLEWIWRVLEFHPDSDFQHHLLHRSRKIHLYEDELNFRCISRRTGQLFLSRLNFPHQARGVWSSFNYSEETPSINRNLISQKELVGQAGWSFAWQSFNGGRPVLLRSVLVKMPYQKIVLLVIQELTEVILFYHIQLKRI